MSTPPNDPPKNGSNTHHDEDDFDLDFDSDSKETSSGEDFDISELDDIEQPAHPVKAAPPPPAAAAATTAMPSGTLLPDQKVSVEEIPLPVVVEVGRIQMSVKKLLELQPGNMLDLNIHPEAGVDLVVNGKRIARGEILRIGEALGVRIIELY